MSGGGESAPVSSPRPGASSKREHALGGGAGGGASSDGGSPRSVGSGAQIEGGESTLPAARRLELMTLPRKPCGVKLSVDAGTGGDGTSSSS